MYDKTPDSLLRKLKKIRYLVTDCDGVLTDCGVYYSDAGECLKRFNIRDGLGVERLRTELGIETIIISGELSVSLQRRADKLKIKECHLGVRNKSLTLYALADRIGHDLDQFAYIGDDVNDLAVMSVAGATACPADGFDSVRLYADYVCVNRGGHGAFREFAELIIWAQTNDRRDAPALLISNNTMSAVAEHVEANEIHSVLMELEYPVGC